MITSLVEAALRSLALAIVVRIGIAAFRVTNPRQEKIVWTIVLLSALAMPALQHLGPFFVFPAFSFQLPNVGLHGNYSDASRATYSTVPYVYLAVTILLLTRFTVGIVRIRRIELASIPIEQPWTRGLDVRYTHRLSNPATFGSTILLPACFTDWSDDKRSLIIKHEASHVRHFDSQVQWLAMLHVCIAWFSPLSWWLSRRLPDLAEHASDDAVLQENIPRAEYAAMLLEMAQAQPPNLLAVGVASRSIEQRIDRILSSEQLPRPVSYLRRALAIFAVVPLVAVAVDLPAVGGGSLSGSSEGKALYGMDETRPHIVASPSNEDLKKWYPADAAQQGVDGLVQINVTLDASGRATDTLVLSETPLGLGFGAAASELAHIFKYVNQTGRPTSITYRIKFELDRGGHTALPAPGTGPQATTRRAARP